MKRREHSQMMLVQPPSVRVRSVCLPRALSPIPWIAKAACPPRKRQVATDVSAGPSPRAPRATPPEPLSQDGRGCNHKRWLYCVFVSVCLSVDVWYVCMRMLMCMCLYMCMFMCVYVYVYVYVYAHV